MTTKSYGPAIDELLSPLRRCELGPCEPNRVMQPKLQALTIEAIFGEQPIVDCNAARCCLSGLWLLHDFLDESHSISQEIETPEGSYWHGIMHRREPDYGNSKYWFRRVGHHEIFPQLLSAAQRIIAEAGAHDSGASAIAQASDWDPYHFIDWCDALARGKAKQRELAARIAWEEWRLLFADCYRRAVSG